MHFAILYRGLTVCCSRWWVLRRDRTCASALCVHFTLHSSVPAPYYATVPVGLARRLGPFDATMIVMGGIIGSGIFINPYVVARQVHTPLLILGALVAGGGVAALRALPSAPPALLPAA